MTINQIMSKPGCWLGGGGPLSDIVIPSISSAGTRPAGDIFK